MKRACNGLLLLTGSLWMMDGEAACQLQTIDGKPAAPFVANLDITGNASFTTYHESGEQLGFIQIDLERANTHKISCDKEDYIFREYKTSKPLIPLPSEHDGYYATELKDVAFVPLTLDTPRLLQCNRIGSKGKECVFNNLEGENRVFYLQAAFVANGSKAKPAVVQPGIIHGSSLPQFTVLAGQPDSMIPIGYVTFSGAFTITKPTCTTPDVQVQMGKWDINDFKGPDKATEWQYVNYYLEGCGMFYEKTGYISLFVDTGWRQYSWGPQFLVKTLNPQNGFFDRKKGIINIQPGSQSATGVGIQLATNKLGVIKVIDFEQEWSSEIPTPTDRPRIQFLARYIQTENSITPGIADGRATITFTYR
ncbi:type 1 fimbrial protein [Citrobacter sp. Cs237]|uniref:fimbrial protein n=1 Tax=Citrobacter TaxID=544 RepID=UPI002577EBDD|nr:fimbrial protein [Citrobacter sp. Cs237]MDM2751683.1 type 1 fimbrial protein [Citrobacter sp. Cs237]HBU8851332.1 type 1 fimbrial protein [Citrobacter sedlakii]